MTPAARYLFIALFVLAAAGLIVYAVRVWKSSGKQEEAQEPPKDEDNMK